MDTTKELPTVIAFCAGYGGIERGLDLAGLEHRVVAYVERSLCHCKPGVENGSRTATSRTWILEGA